MYLATSIDGVLFFTPDFIVEKGIFVGEPTEQMPIGPDNHRLISDTIIQLDILSSVPLIQDVSDPGEYRTCYERYISQDENCKITVDLYFVAQEDIDLCEVEYLDENHKWEWHTDEG